MIVTCPSCLKRYMLDEGALTPEGRQVRCASCQHVWRHMPDEAAPLRPLPFLGFPQGESVVDSRSFTKKRVSWMKWGLLGLLLGCVVFFVFCRQTVVRVWPESQRGYALLGLSARLPGAGLSISNPTLLTHQEGPVEMIVVGGNITNTSSHVQAIPPLKITLVGEDRAAPLDYWEHRLAEHSLLPGETIRFEAAPRPQVAGAQHVVVEF